MSECNRPQGITQNSSHLLQLYTLILRLTLLSSRRTTSGGGDDGGDVGVFGDGDGGCGGGVTIR